MRYLWKYVFPALVVLLIGGALWFFWQPTLAAGKPVKVVFNESPLPLDPPAFVRDGTVYLPLKYVAVNTGYEVNLDSSGKEATVKGYGLDLHLTAGKNEVRKNGEAVTFSSPPRTYRGQFFVPVEVAEKLLHLAVTYDEAEETVHIEDMAIHNANNKVRLTIGMSPEEVVSQLGEPQEKGRSFQRSVDEKHDMVYYVYKKNGEKLYALIGIDEGLRQVVEIGVLYPKDEWTVPYAERRGHRLGSNVAGLVELDAVPGIDFSGYKKRKSDIIRGIEFKPMPSFYLAYVWNNDDAFFTYFVDGNGMLYGYWMGNFIRFGDYHVSLGDTFDFSPESGFKDLGSFYEDDPERRNESSKLTANIIYYALNAYRAYFPYIKADLGRDEKAQRSAEFLAAGKDPMPVFPRKIIDTKAGFAGFDPPLAAFDVFLHSAVPDHQSKYTIFLYDGLKHANYLGTREARASYWNQAGVAIDSEGPGKPLGTVIVLFAYLP